MIIMRRTQDVDQHPQNPTRRKQRKRGGKRRSGKKGYDSTWKLDLQAPTTTDGTSTRLHLSPVLYNVYTKRLAGMNSNDLSRVLSLADDWLIYKTASDIHTAVTVVHKQVEMVPHWCHNTESEINPIRCKHPQQQSSSTSSASCLLPLRSHRTREQSQIPRDPL